MDTYSVKDASRITGISKPALRIYTNRYSRYLSSEATPPAGQARVFTAEDLRLLKFVFDATSAGATHDVVEGRLAAGELDAYPWHVPQADVPDADAPADSAAMMPQDMVRVTAAFLEEYRSRETALQERERELLDRLERLQRELGETQGRLAELRANRYRAPRWIRVLFGGRGD
jgi:DNA-binding transcriptional MerR regulator